MKIIFFLHFLCTVNRVKHSYGTSAVQPQILFAKDGQKPGHRFQDKTNFLRFLLGQISYSNFWEDRRLQGIAQTIFDIRFRPKSLTFPTSFFLCYSKTHILIFVQQEIHKANCMDPNSSNSVKMCDSFWQAAACSVEFHVYMKLTYELDIWIYLYSLYSSGHCAFCSLY